MSRYNTNHAVSLEQLRQLDTVYDLGLGEPVFAQITKGLESMKSIKGLSDISIRAAIISDNHVIKLNSSSDIVTLEGKDNNLPTTTTPVYSVGLGNTSESNRINVDTLDFELLQNLRFLHSLQSSCSYFSSLLDNARSHLVGTSSATSQTKDSVNLYVSELITYITHMLKGRTEENTIEVQISRSTYNNDKIGCIGSISCLLSVLYDEPVTVSWNNEINKSTENMVSISAVAQFSDFRVPFISSARKYPSYTWNYNNRAESYEYNTRLGIYKETHKVHDYLDLGRKIISGSRIFTTIKYNECRTPLEDMFFNNDLENSILPKNMEKFVSYLNKRRKSPDPSQVNLFDNSDINRCMRLEEKKEQEKQKEGSVEIIIETKVIDKLASLSTTKPLILQGINYYSDRIEYEGQVLKNSNDSAWVKSFVNGNFKLQDWQTKNFDDIFNCFVDYVAKFEGLYTVGSVLVYRTEHRVNATTYTAYIPYINNRRINRGELSDCIRRAMCFDKQEPYDAFVKSVSQCSLRIHGYLHDGMLLRIDGFGEESYLVRINLIRKKNINYIKINEDLLRVSNLAKLERFLQKDQDPIRFLDTATKKGTMGLDILMTTAQVGSLIKDGKKAYETAMQKSKKLLEDTEKLLKIKVSTHQLANKGEVIGYFIAGKRRNYVVEASGDNSVYDANTGTRFCIVDKSTDQTGKDKLVNRLFAISNDALVASRISTI